MKTINNTLIVVSLLFINTLTSTAGATSAADAFKLYTNKNYSAALAQYQSMVSPTTANDDLYYNIGNCYFKLNEIGHAVAYYEKALKLNPTNTEAKTNLQFCNKRLIDKVDTSEPFVITKWANAVSNALTTSTWAIVIVVSVLLFAIVLYRFLVIERTAYALAAMAGCALMLILSIACANANYTRLTNVNSAIVTTPTLHVKSGPTEQSAELFTLHEGCKIIILQQVDTWLNIQVNNGNIGWIKTTEVIVI